jgi:ERCC4-type nuclease
MAKLNKDYLVIVDTREKTGYSFREYDTCRGMIKRKLDTGDYSIDGLEDIICIERKACVEEIANNIIDTSKRFDREIARMETYKHKYLICEFSMVDIINFPNGTGLPADIKKNTKITGKFLLKRLMEYQINHGVSVIFCGNKENAFYFVASLLKRLSEKYL